MVAIYEWVSFPLLGIQVSVLTIRRPTLIYSKSMATNRWAKGNEGRRGRYSNGSANTHSIDWVNIGLAHAMLVLKYLRFTL